MKAEAKTLGGSTPVEKPKRLILSEEFFVVADLVPSSLNAMVAPGASCQACTAPRIAVANSAPVTSVALAWST